ncbi:MAG: phospholipase [Dehalococcoidia bacterium]|nr:MAG: phospholipase [Dehalococcoidia bacterium]
MSRRLWAFSLAALAVVLCLAVATLVVLRLAEPGSAPSAPASSRASWYQLWFTTPRFPDRPEDQRGGIDEQFVAFLDGAQRQLDLADYDFDLTTVAQALARARARGVTVRFVTDTDTLESDDRAVRAAFTIVRNAGIPIVDDRRSAIMHHKFAVRDGDAVWTGSWNFTRNDTYRHNNAALVIFSPEVAANYTAEFEKMFQQRQFGPAKPAGVPYRRVRLDGATVETYFAPQDNVQAAIVARVQAAQTSIVFLAFQFTSDPIAQAMIARLRQGVRVAGAFERTGSETPFSEFRQLQQAGAEVYQDGNPYIMHHKVIVVDERVVMTGSYNFTDNANRQNDENLLIIEDRELARRFLEEFERVRETALRPPR